MNRKLRLVKLSLFLCAATFCSAQTPFALLPAPRACFYDSNGAPLIGGQVSSYAAGTTTPLATYTDSTGTIQNSNPVILDAAGCASIFIGPQLYKIKLADSNGAQLWIQDNISDVGQLLYTKAVLLAPAGAVLQTIVGPLAANYFQGITPHTTSPNVRVSLLAPSTTLDTASNPPIVDVTAPTAANHHYTVPDPGTAAANFVLNPNGTTNTLDCTQAGITCKRTAYIYFEGGGCNNATSAMGWDTFGNNAPTPMCVTGANIQKGVLSLPGAATRIHENQGTAAASTTVTTTYNNGTSAGEFLVAKVAVDGGKTVSGCTDGTNAYSLAKRQQNGNTGVEIWYFNGNSTGMAANTTLTCTLSAAANAAIDWTGYTGLVTASILDQTAGTTGTGTAVSTGATPGTAQATELVIAAMASPSNPTVTFANGWAGHATVSQSTNITVSAEGLIQQVSAPQSATFTISSSQAWAGAIATFKINMTQATATAQRQFVLPAFYLSSAAVNAGIKWQAPIGVSGTVNVRLGAQVVCSADGGTDDPAFNAATVSTVAVNPSGTGILTSTALNTLTASNCAAGNILHFQIERLRFDPADTYEGPVYVNGATLQFGITQ